MHLHVGVLFILLLQSGVHFCHLAVISKLTAFSIEWTSVKEVWSKDQNACVQTRYFTVRSSDFIHTLFVLEMCVC